MMHPPLVSTLAKIIFEGSEETLAQLPIDTSGITNVSTTSQNFILGVEGGFKGLTSSTCDQFKKLLSNISLSKMLSLNQDGMFLLQKR